MTSSTKVRKIAKSIFKSIQNETGVSEEKLNNFLKIFRENKNIFSQQIFARLAKLIEEDEESKILLIETPYPIGKDLETELKNKFEIILKKKLTTEVAVDKNLIGGIKITNQDNRWEDTIESNLQHLKGTFVS